MKNTNPAFKKIDLFWAGFTVLALVLSLTTKAVDYFLPIMTVFGIIQTIRKIIPKFLYNTIKILLVLGLLYNFYITFI